MIIKAHYEIEGSIVDLTTGKTFSKACEDDIVKQLKHGDLTLDVFKGLIYSPDCVNPVYEIKDVETGETSYEIEDDDMIDPEDTQHLLHELPDLQARNKEVNPLVRVSKLAHVASDYLRIDATCEELYDEELGYAVASLNTDGQYAALVSVELALEVCDAADDVPAPLEKVLRAARARGVEFILFDDESGGVPGIPTITQNDVD